ncbi:hypothetical protein GCM10009660_15610 [Catellatospora bangladeshensis]
MTTAPSAPVPESAADQVGRLVDKALADLDRITGSAPATRPAHLAQLDAVLREGVQQARQLEGGSTAVDRDSDLWRLREPGYLRGICDHPVDRAGSTLPLWPVVLTWGALAYAEWNFLQDHRATPVAQRPSFFADWMSQPLLRGPFGLSLAIVVTVLIIMVRYRKPARAQSVADEVDRIAHRLEVDLLRPLTVLRARLGPVRVEEHARQAAVELAASARLFTTATAKLADSTAVVDRLVSAVERMVAALPDLGEQSGKLDEVRARLDRTAQVITTQLDPLASVVSDVTDAAESARTAVDRSAEVLLRAEGGLAEAREVADRHDGHRQALAQAQQPFADVAEVVSAAAGRLGDTASLLQETVTQLRATVDGVNWLAMVSDGLRDAEERHGGNGAVR